LLQTNVRFEPISLVVEQIDHRDWHIEGGRKQTSDIVVRTLFRRIQYQESPQFFEALGVVTHDGKRSLALMCHLTLRRLLLLLLEPFAWVLIAFIVISVWVLTRKK
jgi:hypothetical protein